MSQDLLHDSTISASHDTCQVRLRDQQPIWSSLSLERGHHNVVLYKQFLSQCFSIGKVCFYLRQVIYCQARLLVDLITF